MEEPTKNWGGKREGAGRKRTTSSYVGLKVPEDVEAILANLETMTKSQYIVAAIREKYASDCEKGIYF